MISPGRTRERESQVTHEQYDSIPFSFLVSLQAQNVWVDHSPFKTGLEMYAQWNMSKKQHNSFSADPLERVGS